MTPKERSEMRSLQRSLNEIGKQLKSIASNTEPKDKPADPHLQEIVVSKLNLPVAIAEYYQSEKHEFQRKKRLSRLMTLIDILGLVFLGAYVAATWSTLEEIKKQTPFVKQAAEAAKDAATIADSSLKISEQPWMTVENCTLSSNPQSIRMIITIKNVGKQPALRVRMHAKGELTQQLAVSKDLGFEIPLAPQAEYIGELDFTALGQSGPAQPL